ncbi:class I SAM-dependent methyltransferase [Rhodophyticola sp.]|jgi:SAM-dependent methyltransferase|uniref:class I SAM-dependent methyltransferase n=1 Tax=Rhodophyticola sp. TaxID=2680032 RepID=UPI001B0ED62E|nr:class I SAM-dependent methyltransferase [Roseicyclus sp.]MBO6624003.1 class I SAM-dependent methyltransferase [Roseicyclus sp.]MBO6922988.1 class I SAM-dependent methyltransferase [Roseicyclus sp.]
MTDQETLRAYSARVDEYAAVAMTEIQARAMEDFLSHLPPGAHVLDVGCGPGVHAAAMQEAGFRVTALDPTAEFVEAARARGVDARLGSFDDVTETDLYDGVWASFSLLHARRADFARHFAALAKALKPGGHLFLGMKLGTGEARDDIGRFYTYYTEPALREHLEDAGLTVLSAETGEGRGLTGTLDPYILIIARG